VQLFLQQVIDGVATGCIYGALAIALVLIYRSTGILNFAQGEMAMFSTFIAWNLVEVQVPVYLAIPLAMAISFIGGLLLERLVMRPVEGSPALTVVIVTLGLFLIINSAAGLIWGHEVRAFPSLAPKLNWTVGQVEFTGQTVSTIAVLTVQVLLLYLLFQHTRLGLAIRAAALRPESSRLVGISVSTMMMLGWGLAAATGALSGALVAPKLFLEPNMMFGVLLYAFAGAALGGLNSWFGAVIGGVIVGVTENLAGTYIGFIGSDLKVLVPFALIIGVLMFRPAGLFGMPELERT
jgi:branched-chain amino acid transport system permease protein